MTVYHTDTDESISAAVVWVLGAATGTWPADFRPLYESVDPGALDSLISCRDTDETGKSDRDQMIGEADRLLEQ